MKKLLVFLLSILLLTACSSAPAEEEQVDEVEVIKVALLVGELGDLSFNDSAARGVNRAAEEFSNVEVDIVEYGSAAVDNYEPTLLDTADAGYDLIFASSTLQDLIEQYAPDYPETTFGVFDTQIDFTKGDLSNVYGIVYKANEASFLGGYLAASLSQTGTLAFLGGMDIPVISDFLVGYIQGAQLANPDIKVTTTYAGSWGDAPAGKDLANTMFDQGADVIFNVAGGTGIGGIEASVERGLFSLGVDSDQAMIYDADGKTDFANAIVSSVLKNVDYSLYRAITMYMDGTLAVGTNETLGIAEGGVGLADNKYYQANVSEEIRTAIADLEAQVTAGEIEIMSAYGMSTEEIAAIRDQVKP